MKKANRKKHISEKQKHNNEEKKKIWQERNKKRTSYIPYTKITNINFVNNHNNIHTNLYKKTTPHTLSLYTQCVLCMCVCAYGCVEGASPPKRHSLPVCVYGGFSSAKKVRVGVWWGWTMTPNA